MPTIVVQRGEPEGVETKSTTSGRSRRVPVADRILPIVRDLAADRAADARLFVLPTRAQGGPPFPLSRAVLAAAIRDEAPRFRSARAFPAAFLTVMLVAW